MPIVTVKLIPVALEVGAGARATLKADVSIDETLGPNEQYVATWYAWNKGDFVDTRGVQLFNAPHKLAASKQPGETPTVMWEPGPLGAGRFKVSVRIYLRPRGESLRNFINRYIDTPHEFVAEDEATIDVRQAPADPTRVTMMRADVSQTSDQALWTVIRNSTNALSYQKYSDFMDTVLCGEINDPVLQAAFDDKKRFVRLNLPFPDVDAYRQLRVATEVFMMLNCGVTGVGAVSGKAINIADFDRIDLEELDAEGRRYYKMALRPGDIERYWTQYLNLAATQKGRSSISTLPYLALIRRKLKDVSAVDRNPTEDEATVTCMDMLMTKLTMPCFLELIWSYWHEEGMLVQTMNAITWRFQNRRGPTDHDPLALLEIDPLRSLNNFIWGYIQDEQHRLTVARRAYEYDHHYGLTMLGKAVPQVRGADSRTRFLEAFHHLLYVCSIFLKEDDDTTVVADGFPVLNALKEVHLLLTQGAHNQYGDLPWTARQEMLMQEWMLGRPEFREFLPRRIMVDYPEDWMDSVETMKTLQGWTDSSIMHFRDLGVFGEQVLLGIRFGAWPSVIESAQAANWVRYWRPEIQGYIHAYRAVTGVDMTDRVDATMPALLLKRRGAQQALPESARALGEPRRGLPDYPRGLPQAAQRSLPSKTTR